MKTRTSRPLARVALLCSAALLLVVARPAIAAAEESGKYYLVLEKQQAKEKHRWSITDWLDTRDRMRVQDLWLSLHMPSPYEFYADVAYQSATLQAGGAVNSWGFTAAAYATIFGVELQYITGSQDPRWLILANVRLFGAYHQATNFTLQGGVKMDNRSGVQLWNPVAGAQLTVYISKPVGITALYRHSFPHSQGIALAHDRFEAGAFIDFSFVRLHGEFVVETTVTDPTHSFGGFQLGTRFYF